MSLALDRPQPKAPKAPKPPKLPKAPKQPKAPKAPRGSALGAAAPPYSGAGVHPTSRELESIRSLLQDNGESPLSLLLQAP